MRVVDALADDLPVEDASFDAAVAALVLCSVPSQAAALAELRRVLRPAGELRFYEHVVARSPGLARFQRATGSLMPRLAGACHPDRDTGAEIERAGFQVERERRFVVRRLAETPVAPRILGRRGGLRPDRSGEAARPWSARGCAARPPFARGSRPRP